MKSNLNNYNMQRIIIQKFNNSSRENAQLITTKITMINCKVQHQIEEILTINKIIQLSQNRFCILNNCNKINNNFYSQIN